jgi:hypothetical protein
MSIIRILGIVISLGLLSFSILIYRLKRIRKSDLLIFFCISLAIFLVSFKPGIVNILTGPLTGIGDYPGGRLLALIIISVFILYGLIFRLVAKINTVDRDLGRLVNALAVSKYQEEDKDRQIENKILVMIPAYNEEDNIGNVLERIPSNVLGYGVEPLVVVDGATDNTEKIAREKGASVIVNRINRGGGAALRTGYEASLSRNAEIVVTLDADGQHRPEEIEPLVKPIIEDEADFTSGSRILGKQEKGSQIRQLGIRFFNLLISLLLWKKITDCSNAYRALKVSELAKLDLKEDRFHTTELIIDAVKKGIRFKEVPITVMLRQSGETKKPRALKYGWNFLATILKTWWRD